MWQQCNWKTMFPGKPESMHWGLRIVWSNISGSRDISPIVNFLSHSDIAPTSILLSPHILFYLMLWAGSMSQWLHENVSYQLLYWCDVFRLVNTYTDTPLPCCQCTGVIWSPCPDVPWQWLILKIPLLHSLLWTFHPCLELEMVETSISRPVIGQFRSIMLSYWLSLTLGWYLWCKY